MASNDPDSDTEFHDPITNPTNHYVNRNLLVPVSLVGSGMEKLNRAWKTVTFPLLPKWLQDNEFLRGGHRPPLHSFAACFKSIFRLHSETGNIWSHGLGCFMFLVIFLIFLFFSPFQAIDKVIIGIFLTACIICLLFSTLFHTCICHSHSMAKLFAKLDYVGICVQIIGSDIPAFYYAFYKDFFLLGIYLGISSLLGVIAIIVCLWDKFGEPRFRSLRAAVFLSFGLSAIIPGVHWFFVMDPQHLFTFIMFCVQGGLYVIGAILYSLRIPERFFPGKCDYWFQSHQMFHILVVAAAIVHFIGIVVLASQRN